tara:strand:+ start:16102 stop:18225 length:2124 start_codon:yes stop_codon:yes gene_type:complete
MALLVQSVEKSPEKMRIRATGFFKPLIFAVALVYGLWALHTHVGSPIAEEDVSGFFNLPALRFKLFMSGPIPMTVLGCFLFGLLYLIAIHIRVAQALNLSFIAEREVLKETNKKFEDGMLSIEELLKRGALDKSKTDALKYIHLERELKERYSKGLLGYVGYRFYRLVRRYNVDHDLTAVLAAKDDMLASDEDDIARRFIAVSWAEAALPLLGFLGTVMGIGEALGRIRQAVMSMLATKSEAVGEADPAANEHTVTLFTQGFQNLALAFDTTFLGLIGLLVLGLLHTKLKKNIALQLATISNALNDIVTQWKSDSPVTLAVESLQGEMVTIRRMFQRIENRLAQATTTILEEVHDPPFPSIRKALMRPYVEFSQLGMELKTNFEKSVSEVLGTRSFGVTGLASIQGTSTGFVAAVESGKGRHIFAFRNTSSGLIRWSHPIEGVVPSSIANAPSPEAAIFRSEKGEVLALRENGKLHKITDYAVQNCGGTAIQDTPFVVVRNINGNFEELRIFRGDGDFSEVDARQLEPGFGRSLDAFHGEGAIALAGANVDHPSTWRIEILQVSRDSAGSAGITGTSSFTEFQPASALNSLQMLSGFEAVALDKKGLLYYWNDQLSRPQVLTHPDWSNQPGRIIAGRSGWLARASNGELAMWRIQQGNLSPYRGKKFHVDGKLFAPTANGKQLLFAEPGSIVGWEFPSDQPPQDDQS